MLRLRRSLKGSAMSHKGSATYEPHGFGYVRMSNKGSAMSHNGSAMSQKGSATYDAEAFGL